MTRPDIPAPRDSQPTRGPYDFPSLPIPFRSGVRMVHYIPRGDVPLIRRVAGALIQAGKLKPTAVDIQADVPESSTGILGEELTASGWKRPTPTHTNLDFGLSRGEHLDRAWGFIHSVQEIIRLRDTLQAEGRSQIEIVQAVNDFITQIGSPTTS